MDNNEKKIIGYNPNTGEAIYSGSENLMEDKKEKKIVGFDANTGFPIYEGTNNINQDNVKKCVKIRMSKPEKILFGIFIGASIISLLRGFIYKDGGIVFACLTVLFVIIESFLYHNEVKKHVSSNINLNNKVLTSTIVVGIIYVIMVVVYLISYIGMVNYLWDLGDDNNPATGWYAILFFWPLYIVISGFLFAMAITFSNKISGNIRKKYNL